MGIWEELRSTAVKLFNRNVTDTPPDTIENRYSYNMGVAKTVTQIGVRSNGAEKLKEYIPDRDRREKFGGILSNLRKFSVEPSITGGIQVYKIVKEGLKDQRPLNSSNESNKPDATVAMEEIQARMEKMEEAMNHIKQRSNISTQSVEGSEPSKKFPDEPVKQSASPKNDPKRVFIRSRL